MIRVTLQFVIALIIVITGAVVNGVSVSRAGDGEAAARVAISNTLDPVGRTNQVLRVDLKAIHGHGAIAVRQGQSLYVADGDVSPNGTFRRIETGAIVRTMAWSHDERFLAFASSDALWIAARNAAGGKRITLPANSGFTFSWSPRADVLALNVSPFLGNPPDYKRLRAPDSSPQRIVTKCSTALVRPDGSSTRLALDACPEQFRWSNDGNTIVQYTFAATRPYTNWTISRDGIYTAKLGGGETLRATSDTGGQLALAALVPSQDALLLWSGTERSASNATDGQNLTLLAPGSGPKAIGFGLTHPSWQTFSDDGSRFVFVAGRLREAWSGKSLIVCTIAGKCRPLPHATETIGLDPRWRPRSPATIAFVRANDIGSNGGYGDNFFTKWLPARTLWLQDVDSGNARPLIAFGGGIFCPRWSNDGREIMVYRNGTMLLGPVNKQKAIPVVSGLVRPRDDQDAFMGDHGAFDDCPVEWTGE